MILIKTKIEGAYIIKPIYHEDNRGSFYTSFSRDCYNDLGIYNFNVSQMNTSISNKNVVRGLHYQSGLNAQAKLVWVSNGSVLDVFVDLRKYSPTFGEWGAEKLIPNGNKLFIPKGCAHGFISLNDGTEFNYLCSNAWNKESERTLLWNDPDLNIDWQLDGDPIISKKDLEGVFFKYCEKYDEE